MIDEDPEWKFTPLPPSAGHRPKPIFTPPPNSAKNKPKPPPNLRPLTKREESILAAMSVTEGKTAKEIAAAAGFAHFTGVLHYLQRFVRFGFIREENPTGKQYQYFLIAPSIHGKKLDGDGKVVAEEFQNWPEEGEQ